MPKVKRVEDIPMSDFIDDAVESGSVDSSQVLKSENDMILDNLVKVITANSELADRVDDLTLRVSDLERPFYKKLLKK